MTSPAGPFDYGFSPGAGDRTQNQWITLLGGVGTISTQYDEFARLYQTELSGAATHNLHIYGYNAANQRTQQVFTANNFINYT